MPKYWEYLKIDQTATENAYQLFFRKGAPVEFEPERLLRDELVTGQQARSVLECIGRGARRPSEIAGRMGISQTSLSSPLQQLLHTSLIEREVPFGESVRTTKLTLYSISDSALAFWFNVYSPHRSRWHLYSIEKQHSLIHQHAAQVLESVYRGGFIDAQRYWEKDFEFNLVRYDPADLSAVIVAEIKHRELNEEDRTAVQMTRTEQFKRSKLSKKFKLSRVDVLGTRDVLKALM